MRDIKNLHHFSIQGRCAIINSSLKASRLFKKSESVHVLAACQNELKEYTEMTKSSSF